MAISYLYRNSKKKDQGWGGKNDKGSPLEIMERDRELENSSLLQQISKTNQETFTS